MSFSEVLPPHNAIWTMVALTLAFLVGLRKKWFKKIIKNCSTNYPKGLPLSDADRDIIIDDLERIGCSKGLGNLWNETAKGGPFTILLTGASGYLGQLIVFILLHRIQNDTSQNKSKHKILLLMRPKKGRKTAQERADKIKDMHIFDSVRGVWDHSIQVVETSDMNLPNAGIADSSIKMLNEAEVTHLIHCAADVGFTKTLEELASVNISSSLHLQKLTHQWPSCKRMVYVSTAFVHPEHGTPETPLPEQLADLGGHDPMKLYESMKGDRKLAEQVMKERGFVNNYVFTKSVSEHLLSRDAKTELAVVRPAVVGPAWMQPIAGWNGEKPSTASTLGLLLMSRMCRICPVSYSPFPLIPVDVCAVGVVHAMISPTINKFAKQQADRTSFRNLIWGASSPLQLGTMDEALTGLLQYAVAKKLISRAEAAFTTTFSMIVTTFPGTIPVLHQIFNRGPLLLPYYGLLLLEKIGLVKKGTSSDLKLLLPFVDVARLYEPFITNEYYFESSMHLPASFDIDFYGEKMAIAVHNFMTLVREKNDAKKLKKKAEKQKEKAKREPYPFLPLNWYVFVLIPLLGFCTRLLL